MQYNDTQCNTMKMNDVIMIRLPVEMKEYIQGIANSRMLKVSDVVRVWLLEKMPDEIKASILRGKG